MGQDVDRTLFSRRDRQTYRSKVQRCLDALTLMLREHPFARDEPMTGVEVELNLVDGDLVPALRGRQVLDALRGADFQPELGRWNMELNLPPRPLPGDEWRQFEHQLTDQLGLARSAAGSCGARLAVIGILPTIEPRHLVVDALSREDRYAVLNEQLMSLRGEPIRLDIAGDDPSGRHAVAPDHLFADFDSIAPEAACTSMQLHLQVHPDAFAGYWNAAQCLAGVQLAVGANSPFLLRSRLWAETRIPLFEQSCDVRTVELRNQGVRPRVWFGERWISSILDLFSENGRYFPGLLPLTEDTDPLLELKEGRVPAAGRAAAAQRHDLALEPPGVRRGGRGAARARREPGAARRADGRRHGRQRPAVLRAAAGARGGRAAVVELDVVRGGAGELHHRRAVRARRGAVLAGVGVDPARRAGAAQAAAAGGGRAGALGGGGVGDRPLPLGHRAAVPAPADGGGVAARRGRGAGAARCRPGDGAARHVRALPGAFRGQRAGAHVAAAARRVSSPLSTAAARTRPA